MCITNLGKLSIYFYYFWVFIYSCLSFRSQYFDPDGDLAHEFYEEQIVEDRAVMIRQCSTSLRHEGWIQYPVPRLHYDFPAVIMSN